MRGKINYCVAGILLLIFCIFQYGIRKICGFSLYPDEFGYWASAAGLAGYDWSEIASLGPYYSFGYSLILFPVLKLFGDGIVAYRAAIVANMLLMCGGIFLMKKILEKIFPDAGSETGYLLGGMAVLYPAWIFYMQMTMTEAILFFVFILDVYLFMDFMERQRVWAAVALAVSLAYGYCVHMRTVGTVVACMLALLCWLAFGRGRKRGLAVGCGVLLIAGLLAVWLRERTATEIYALAGPAVFAGKDYGGQMDKLAQILTVSGMLQLIKDMAGKLYYLGIASFGTFYWGLGWCMKECLLLADSIRQKKDTEPLQWTALFLLLSVMGQIAVSSIFMYNPSVIDCLVYGRYNELLVPVMMIAGVAAMIKSRRLIPVTALIGAALGGGTFWVLHEIETRHMSGIRGYHVPGISYLLQEDNMNVEAFFGNTWLLGCGMMALVCAFVWLGRRNKRAWWLFSGILAIEIAAGLQISGHYTYKVNEFNFQSYAIVERLEESITDGKEIFYLDEGEQPFVDFLQMQIPDQSIRVCKAEKLTDADPAKSVVITSVETRQDEALSQLYDKKMTANPFCLYYN